ncbi:MAG: hypothetical protein JWN66_197 [Sphingomonas bacterium]|uniref:hypothetical protein n=1 Tax=Sphingomonas bacterium TaxID=1895847 RepID=UPI002620FAD6|nr:hypothetical protein [Sphingomonas bacterium]MDB5703081.1 hypothetical protein [Sphingomonas bacterium]
MKNHPANRRAFAALIPATLLLAMPAFAQEVQPAPAPPVEAVAPPPVVPTIAPPAATVAPPPAEAVTPAPEAVAPAPVRTTRTVRTAQRVVRSTAPARAAPVRAAPAPVAVAPAPAPVEVAPAPVAQPPVEAAAPAPVAPAATTQSTTTTQSAATWPWMLGGALILLGAIAFFVLRRRRVEDEDYYEEPYVEAAAVEAAPIRNEPAPFAPAAEPAFLNAAPIAVAPVAVINDGPAPLAAEEAELAEPEAEDVAALTEGTAPVADRPWLEFALRPVRAGTNVDEALVEIELTVGNSGSVAAKDVRISTFMFASEPANAADMEQMLVDRGNDGVEPVTIEPGEGTRVDATLALSKADLIETTNGSIRPIVVAEARYPLPDGTEGRTSASFTIGVSEEGGPVMAPIQLNERAMHDDVEARLYGVPEHA